MRILPILATVAGLVLAGCVEPEEAGETPVPINDCEFYEINMHWRSSGAIDIDQLERAFDAEGYDWVAIDPNTARLDPPPAGVIGHAYFEAFEDDGNLLIEFRETGESESHPALVAGVAQDAEDIVRATLEGAELVHLYEESTEVC